MLPDGPTTTTVAPPFGLAARENATHASASFRAVSRLISCRWARLVASGDIVTSASFAGGVCAEADVAMSHAPRNTMRRIVLSPGGWRSLRCTRAAATPLSGQLRLSDEHVRMLGVHVRVDRLVAHAVAVLVHVAQRLLEQRRRRIPLWHRAFEDVQPVGVHRD